MPKKLHRDKPLLVRLTDQNKRLLVAEAQERYLFYSDVINEALEEHFIRQAQLKLKNRSLPQR